MDQLLTEARNPASANLDELSSIEIVRLMNAEDSTVAAAVATQAEAIARAIDAIAERLRNGGRLIYVGAGTSGRLGVLDASECPPTFNSPPDQVIGLIAGGMTALTTAVEGAEDHPEFAEADLRRINLSSADVLVGIATSGRTPYVIGALRYARSVGACAIGLACVSDPALAIEADFMIVPLVGPEVLTGSTRLKAGTATKMVLNMLTTGAMVRIGKTFGNLMVDLRATNVKLKARTNRIVRELLGVNADDADALLSKCGGELKTAIIAGKTGLSASDARGRLDRAAGRISVALQDQPIALRHTNHIIGVDGGGTRTRALLASIEDGTTRIVGRGEAGPSSLHAVGTANAFAAIDRAIAAAFTDAGLSRGPVAIACLGLAGAGRESEQNTVREWAMRAKLADVIDVVGDVELPIALLPDGWGVVVVAGTGSCVFGKSSDGRRARAGGWGPILGDDGSGHSLALEALRRVMQAADGCILSASFLHPFLQSLHLSEPAQLLTALHGGGWDRARLAMLAVDVLRLADEGDVVATEIVDGQILKLAEKASTVIGRLRFNRDSVPLALAGGLLTHGSSYRDRFINQLRGLGIKPSPIVVASEPAQGALCLAHSLHNSAHRK